MTSQRKQAAHAIAAGIGMRYETMPMFTLVH